MTTQRGIANRLDVIAAQLAAVTAELRVAELSRKGETSTDELVAAVEELTARIGRLEQARERPPQAAYGLKEAAARLGLPPGQQGIAGSQRLYRMYLRGELKAFRVGRALHVSASELDRLIDTGLPSR
jgi:outer membrane murein-binding lipoprotein Lpp